MYAVTAEIGLPSGTDCHSIGAVAAENSRPPIRRFCHKIPHLSTARTGRVRIVKGLNPEAVLAENFLGLVPGRCRLSNAGKYKIKKYEICGQLCRNDVSSMSPLSCYGSPRRAQALSDDERLTTSDVCMSRISGQSREPRGLGRLKLAQM